MIEETSSTSNVTDADATARIPEEAGPDPVPAPAVYGTPATRARILDSVGAEWRPFPVGSLPDTVALYVEAAAAAIGADPAFVALPMLSALSASIGNRAVIELKSSWSAPATLWTAVVAESGSLKSPALNAALLPIHTWQNEAVEAFQREMQRFREEEDLYQKAVKESRGKGRSIPKRPARPICDRLVFQDVTIEALAVRLQETRRSALIASDELSSWFGSFDRYSGGKGSDVSRWLSLYDLSNLIIDRKTADPPMIFVPNATVSITGTIQPEVLQEALGREHFANGLAARFLLALPPRKRKRWTEAVIDPQLEKDVFGVFSSLLALEQLERPDGRLFPRPFPLTGSGKSRWVEYYNEHAELQHRLSGDLLAASAKLEAVTARLALINHMVRLVRCDASLENSAAIDAASIEAAVQLSRWFEHETRRVYGVLAESPQERKHRKLLELIGRRGGRITARALQQSCRAYPDSDTADAALQELVGEGLGRWQAVPPGPKGGQPTRVFLLFTSTARTDAA